MDEPRYAEVFARLGRPLGQRDGVSPEDLRAVEERLGCTVPHAVASFYLVAGQAKDFTNHYDHFLPPHEWTLDADKLVFLAENQAVVLYAADLGTPGPDPPVFMASNEEPFEWFEVCRSCSEFVSAMLHWEGSFGGAMPISGSALVPETIRAELERRLVLVGEVNEMWAYGRSGLAACFLHWSDGWRIFVGAATEEALHGFVNDLHVEVELDE